ncbi:MAG: MerR family transcriptional regulator [Planctomycetota bacterium]|nr:MAG: MerR family transcriptional regulator [Planctomycetota bacterium]
MTSDTTFDIHALSHRSGIRVRTIRFYTAQGLVPPPEGRGSGALYRSGHLERLLLIRHLQAAHLPLAAIRNHLEDLDDHAVSASLAAAESEQPPPPSAMALHCAEPAPPNSSSSSAASPATDSAADYVQRLLASARTESSPAEQTVAKASRSSSRSTSRTAGPSRSTWERVSITEDIEIHVRRPLTRSDQRRLTELLETADTLFAPPPSQQIQP